VIRGKRNCEGKGKNIVEEEGLEEKRMNRHGR
jgi:hypothetical protein